MMTVKVFRNDVLEVEHELHQMSLNNGYMSVFMTGGLVSLGLAVGDLVNVQVYDGDGKVADVTATFESYQFSMSSYVSNGGDGSDDGSTQTGVTNNSLVFRVLRMHGEE